MGQRNWEDEYERILDQARSGGRVRVLPSGSERRRHPRFTLGQGEILVSEQVPHTILDLSVSGLSFYSERPFGAGQLLTISLRQLIAIQAEVLGSDVLSGPDAPAPYKIRCRFTDEDYGLRFLVLAMQMDAAEEPPRPN
jgi:PilZ domain